MNHTWPVVTPCYKRCKESQLCAKKRILENLSSPIKMIWGVMNQRHKAYVELSIICKAKWTAALLFQLCTINDTGESRLSVVINITDSDSPYFVIFHYLSKVASQISPLMSCFEKKPGKTILYNDLFNNLKNSQRK